MLEVLVMKISTRISQALGKFSLRKCTFVQQESCEFNWQNYILCICKVVSLRGHNNVGGCEFLKELDLLSRNSSANVRFFFAL